MLMRCVGSEGAVIATGRCFRTLRAMADPVDRMAFALDSQSLAGDMVVEEGATCRSRKMDRSARPSVFAVYVYLYCIFQTQAATSTYACMAVHFRILTKSIRPQSDTVTNENPSNEEWIASCPISIGPRSHRSPGQRSSLPCLACREFKLSFSCRH